MPKRKKPLTEAQIIAALKAREQDWEQEAVIEAAMKSIGLTMVDDEDADLIRRIARPGLDGFMALVTLAKPPEK